MKKFLQCVLEWKISACLMFSGSVLIYMVVLVILGTQPRLMVLVSLLVVSALGTLIQYLAFTDRVVKHLRYSLRMLLFVALFAPMLAVCAVLFHWLPADQGIAWGIFVAIFLVVFVAMTAGFEVYYRIAGRKYDGLLGQYKKQREQRSG